MSKTVCPYCKKDCKVIYNKFQRKCFYCLKVVYNLEWVRIKKYGVKNEAKRD